jgi:aminoglycoside phosphotransferase (APT) family kinase protein
MSKNDSTNSERLSTDLTNFLREQGHFGADDVVLSVDQLDGGWSRNTYKAIAKRANVEVKYAIRAEVGGGLTGTPLATEYNIYFDLQSVDVATPNVFGMQNSPTNDFGGQYFVMDYLEGSAPNLWRADAHEPLLKSWEDDKQIARDFVNNLALIHLIPTNKIPRSLENMEFSQLVLKWQRTYEESRLARDPIIEEAFVWLKENPPKPGRQGLVHGDYRMGNVLISGGRVTAILDWELAHIGDVNYDLGYASLQYVAGAHLRSKTNFLAGVAPSDWIWEEYERITGDFVDKEAVRIWSVLTLAALSVMAIIGFDGFQQHKTEDVRRIWSRWALPGLRREMTELARW